MKALVVGYGSIGRRHIINLSKMDSIEEIIVYTKIIDGFENTYEKKISFIDASILGLGAVTDQYKVDFAIIANETHKHVNTAVILAKKGIHLFIEKPLSHNLSRRLMLLKRIVGLHRIKLCVGYNLRFLGALEFIKTKLSQKAIGKVYFAKIEVGQYLPFWRVGRDYRVSYSASKKLGGGVALDLSHEIDYMRYLFGDPRSCEVVKAKVGNLKIDSEDILEGIYVYSNFVCNVHMDYLQKNKKRIIRIEGERGAIICDFIKKKIIIDTLGRKTIISDKNLFDLDKTYMDEILSFIKSVKYNREPAITLEDGVRVLELIKA